MGCNSLFIRLAAELSLALPPGPSAIELGNQSFKPTGAILDEIERFLRRERRSFDRAAFARLRRMGGAELKRQTGAYFSALGFSAYDCIDINDRYGALVMDLNLDLAQHYNFRRQYDLVTNNGTGEHIFDQAAVFRNIHALTRPGGVMLHAVPFYNYINHGFFSFHTVLFLDLARANGYEVLRLSLADSAGDEVTFADHPPRTTRDIVRLPRSAGAGQAAVKPGLVGAISAGGGRGGSPMAGAIRALGSRKANLLVVAALRRTSAAPFEIPLQGVYGGRNIADPELAGRYAS